MRHRKAGLKLNRNSSHRKAMFRNMVTSLFKYEHIRTTDTKAKELRGLADHLITLAKRGDLHARRQALAIIREKNVVHKLFNEAPARYADVSGGYTRVIKIGRRPGDAATMSLIELVIPESGTAPKKPKEKTKTVQATKSPKAVEKKPVEQPVEEAPKPEEKEETPKPEEKPEERPEEKKDKEETPVNPESDKPTE